jgi:hypothetical protein
VGALIKKGEMVRTVPEGELLQTLLREVAELTGEMVPEVNREESRTPAKKS